MAVSGEVVEHFRLCEKRLCILPQMGFGDV
jgi:hypothetical protein